MPLFKKKNTATKRQLVTDDWNEWHTHLGAERKENEGPARPARRPRSILRNSSYSQQQESSEDSRCRSAMVGSSSLGDVQGGERLQSLPASNSMSAIQATPRKSGENGGFATSTSLSQLNSRGPAKCTYDTESDRLDRACGQGPWSTKPSLAMRRRSSRASRDSRRSRSLSRSGEVQRRPTLHNGSSLRFPHPPIQCAIRDLSHVLRDRTKNFRLKDYLEPEEIESGRIWEEEEETLVDCVRDRLDDQDGEDGVWRAERKKRQMRRIAHREMAKRDGSRCITTIHSPHVLRIFSFDYRCLWCPSAGSSYHFSDASCRRRLHSRGSSGCRCLYRGALPHWYVIPSVSRILQLLKCGLGAYKPNLFRSLPCRDRLLQLVARFDTATLPLTASAKEMKVYAKTPSLHHEQTSDLCALLVTYLTALPDPLIHRSMGDALWAWCVSPSVIRQEQRQRRRGDEGSESEYETSEDEDENAPSYNARLRQMEREYMNLPSLKVQILIAQRLLLLLPPRHFSLLVHLLTFFATLLISSENGLSLDDIGRIFGPMIVGGKTRKQSKHEAAKVAKQWEGQRDSKVNRTLMWLINHWERISAEYEKEETKNSAPPKPTRSASVDHDSSQSRRHDSLSTNCDTLTTGRLENPYHAKADPVNHPSPHQGPPDKFAQQKLRIAYYAGSAAPESRRDSTTSGSTTSSDSELPEVEQTAPRHSAVSRNRRLFESIQMYPRHQRQEALPQYGSGKLDARYNPEDVDDASVYSSGG